MPSHQPQRISLREFLQHHARISRSLFYRDYRHDRDVQLRLGLEEDAVTGSLSVDLEGGVGWAREVLSGRIATERAARARRLGKYAMKGNQTCPVCRHGARKQARECARCGSPLPGTNTES
jgi:hypothetical protein